MEAEATAYALRSLSESLPPRKPTPKISVKNTLASASSAFAVLASRASSICSRSGSERHSFTTGILMNCSMMRREIA
jgi:hypothetical protein